MDLNVTRLRAFLLVAEELSFTHAAARLHVAQQALSTMIRRLERDLGVALFVRTTRTVALTPAGAALAERVRRALGELEAAVGDARRIERSEQRRIVVGVMAGAALELTTPILDAFAREASGVSVELAPHLYDDPSAGLRDGGADVALLRPPLGLRGLSLRPLFSDPRVLVVSSRHRLARRADRGPLTLADVQGEPVIRPASPDEIWNDFWSGEGHFTSTVEASTLEVALELVSAGRAVSIAAAGWTRFYPRPGLRVLRVEGLGRSVVALGWRPSHVSPEALRFVECALRVAREQPKLVRAIEAGSGLEGGGDRFKKARRRPSR